MLFNQARVDILNGQVELTVRSLALPVVALNLLRAGYNIVDMFWIGRLGPDFLAGVSGSIFLVWAIHGLSHLVTTGITAGVSRNIGEERTDRAVANAAKALRYTLYFGILVAVATYPLVPFLISYVGMSETATRAGTQYLQVMTLFTPVIFLLFSLHSLFVARGDTVTPLRVYAATFLLNIGLSPLLMFGWGMIPRLETRGTAYATIISYLVACAWFWIVIRRRRWVTHSAPSPDGIIPLRRYFSLGYPIALTSMMFSFIYFFIARVTALFGDAAVGAMGIGHRVESLAYFFSFGFAVGLSTFVGQNLGAGRPERALAATQYAMRTVGVAATIYTMATVTFAAAIVSLFNDDPGLVAHGVSYLWIVMPAEALQAILIVLEDGAFTGAGYTRPSFSVSLPVTIARIPLAWLLAVFCGLSAAGIWVTIALTMAINAFLFIRIYRSGRWLRTRIV